MPTVARYCDQRLHVLSRNGGGCPCRITGALSGCARFFWRRDKVWDPPLSHRSGNSNTRPCCGFEGSQAYRDGPMGTWIDCVPCSHSWRASCGGNGSDWYFGLAANAESVLILMRYKDGDANVRSVWLCSRNDAIGNVAVMIAALAVW